MQLISFVIDGGIGLILRLITYKGSIIMVLVVCPLLVAMYGSYLVYVANSVGHEDIFVYRSDQ
ncbi:hypothetical protein [Sodalis-like endosymbiont of Proechinophthirus fluctus]|uniref:hypothetical protein n=1 Tax=Sodalis-like endosymbiont of Proechinophthirus fluctus TaxID=1462730 RepID=UPI000A4681A0|nr:hypothetical protein [Sodalis-like endosymbiont of Proechinophthirus fluctus]